jgi:hypothetical protein
VFAGLGFGAHIPPLHVAAVVFGAHTATFVVHVGAAVEGVSWDGVHEPPAYVLDTLTCVITAVQAAVGATCVQLVPRGIVAQGVLEHIWPPETFAVTLHVPPLGTPQLQMEHVAGGATSVSPPWYFDVEPAGHESVLVPV